MKVNKRTLTLAATVRVLIFSVAGCAQPWIRDWLGDIVEEKKSAPPIESGTNPYDATLSGLDLSAGSLAPSFDSDTTNYTVNVPYGTASVAVAGRTNDVGGTVTYSPSPIINLSQATTVVVTATAPGKTFRSYTLGFVVGQPMQSRLTGLTLSIGALTESDKITAVTFSPSNFNYYVTVPNLTTELIVTAQKAPFAAVTYSLSDGKITNGGSTLSETQQLSITVNGGAGYTDQIYTVRVLVSAFSIAAELTSLTSYYGDLYDSGGLSTVSFDPSVSAYRLKSDSAYSLVNANVITVSASGASVMFLGHSGTYPSVTINTPKPSSVPLQILVTKLNHAPTLYTIYFDWFVKPDARLSALSLSESTSFTPLFNAATTSYTANLLSTMKPLIITPTPADAAFAVTYNPANYLTAPANGQIVSVTCDGGVDYNPVTYTITLNVTAVLTDNSLTLLKVNNVDLTAIIDAVMQPAYADIGSPASSFTIEAGIPTGATISYTGATPIASTNNATVSALAEGAPRTVVITVTAQNGDVKTYSLTLYKGGAALSSANNLTSLTVNGMTITPSPLMQPTYAAISSPASSFTIAAGIPAGATISYSGATQSGNNATVAALTAGGTPTTVTITITAESTAVRTYSLILSRPGSSANTLTSLSANGVALTIANEMAPTYAAINSPASSFTIAAVIPAGATISYLGATPIASTTNATVTALAAGATKVVAITVTAQNKTDVKTYSLTFYRPPSGLDLNSKTVEITMSTTNILSCFPNAQSLQRYLVINNGIYEFRIGSNTISPLSYEVLFLAPTDAFSFTFWT